jgi:hypothetical protein
MWHREPGWFATLPRAQQVAVLAEARLASEPPAKSKAPAPAVVEPRRVGRFVR